MAQVEFIEGQTQIDADIVARGLDIDAATLRQGMRDGTVTSSFERGEGPDAGRVRLTFFSRERRVRIVAENTGRILTCVSVPLPRGTVKGAADKRNQTR